MSDPTPTGKKSHHKHKHSRSHRTHRSTLSLQKTEIIINVYDLLPPGRLSSVLWTLGTSLLHSGVVINGKEYAYGGHNRPGITGVYWTRPKTEPPGGHFRCEILHGFTIAAPHEIERIIQEVSEEFLGPSYNLLTKNCNHFTSYLCQKLTGRPGPAWLNRAASIGVRFPCVVPKEWVTVPDFETAEGELVDEDEEEGYGYGVGGHGGDERSKMLRSSDEVPRLVGQKPAGPTEQFELGSEEDERSGRVRAPAVRDAEGRALPPAERAPTL
ncbi:uncharacterized protein CTHT_0053320 [Thermochaetoides thermophila DSM 1495]|uniref:PPPDE domain-containing protein n=1 Tax=Chaetomium thermophilum (strain DSM 1495 / CBS 144.50 / IMI 039719) TaxID=759272 RepID=G0SDX3_CHATD|nr:hypothetical protein CTHT_0053320 [Thermochaetoides thermophila DSM 1495]EGS18724.1 hypothetical protein CTHT_0053320 [Thermochaetoides thermophila DSM 1495]